MPTILGTPGNDTLEGSALDDSIIGDAGNDSIFGNDGADTIYGGEGDDVLSGGFNQGTSADPGDQVYGEGGDDQINGDIGLDTLDGGNGNDTISGGDDADDLYGESGADVLQGDRGNDNLYGGSGNDQITGDSGLEFVLSEDYLEGGNGNDTLKGGGGVDDLLGGGGKDSLLGGDFGDRLNGADSTSRGSGEIDTLIGDGGGDLYVLGDADGIFYNDTLTGRGSGDYAYIQGFDPLPGFESSEADRLLLFGSENDYIVADSPFLSLPGAGIFYDSNHSNTLDDDDELIAILDTADFTAQEILEQAQYTRNGPRTRDSIAASLDSGSFWTGGTVTFSFDAATTEVDTATNTNTSNVAHFAPNVQDLVRSMMNLVSSLTGLVTTEVTGTNASVQFFSADITDAAGYAYYPSQFRNSQVVIDNNYLTTEEITPNQFGHLTLIHEIGHSIGLTHSFGRNTSLDWGEDSNLASVMSYTTFNRFTEPFDTTEIGHNPTGYQIYDIAALQTFYGANHNTRAGNDTYQLDAADPAKQTFWDGAGIDTILAQNNNTAARIDLREGLENYTRQGNILRWIAFDADIENATGAAGHDTLYGNDLANVLRGEAGNDSLDGDSANDVLHAGTGDSDTLIGSAGNDTVAYDFTLRGSAVVTATSADTWTVKIGNFTDFLETVEFIRFQDTTIRISELDGPVDPTPEGATPDPDILLGTPENDLMDGLASADTLSGLAGNDTYIVDNVGDITIELADDGIDTIISSVSYKLRTFTENLELAGTAETGTGNHSDNVLKGSALNNRLIGLGGSDRLVGGPGNDTMTGGLGNDIYFVGSNGDVLTEAPNQGADRVRSTINHTLKSNFETLYLDQTANITGTGNTLHNFLLGNIGRNRLDGGAGNDTIFGGRGNDNLTGSSGKDFLNGTNNGVSLGTQEIDNLTGGSGADKFALGLTGKVLYNDNNQANSGRADFAYITDFVKAQGDVLQLAGNANQYFLANSPIAGKPGRALYFDTNGDRTFQTATDELIAVINSPRILTVANTINTASFV